MDTEYSGEIRPGLIISYVVGLILILGIGVITFVQLQRIGGTVNTLTEELAVNRELAHNIVNQVLLARFYAHTYVSTEHQSDADRFNRAYRELSQLLAIASQQITTPERVIKLKRIENATQHYRETFDAATHLVQERQRLINEELYMQGQRMSLKLTALRVHIMNVEQTYPFLAFGNAQQAVYQMEVSAMAYVDTADERSVVQFENAAVEAEEAFAALRDELQDPYQLLNVEQATLALENYHTGFNEIHAATVELNQLLEVILEEIEPEITTMAAEIVTSIDQEFEAKRRTSQAQLRQAQVVLIFTTATAITASVLLGGLTLRRLAEREQGEMALRNSEERYRTLFEGVPVGLYRSQPNGGLLDANPALMATLGYDSKAALLAIPAEQHYLYPEDHARWLAQMEEKGIVRNFQAQVRQKDGSAIWARENAHAVHAPSREILYYEGSMEDITEQKAADAALRAARDELEQKVQHRTAELRLANDALRSEIDQRKEAEAALREYSFRLEDMVAERTEELAEAQDALVRGEKLALLGQLAGGVGHDLRNPLGVISNAIYFLQMVLGNADDPVPEYLTIIKDEVGNAENIVADLLDFARVKSSDRDATDVGRLVRETLAKCPPPDAVEVHKELPECLPPALIDAQQIERVLINLITNAYQAMSSGGTLTVKTHQTESGVAISVSDTGVGISEDDLDRIFEPLFTTKPKGIGLGLAISRNLVEANKGHIHVHSVRQEGTTFTVHLPAAVRKHQAQ